MKHLVWIVFGAVLPLLASASIPDEDVEVVWSSTDKSSPFNALVRVDQRRRKIGGVVLLEVAVVLLNRSAEILHYRIDSERLVCNGRFDPEELAALGVSTLFNSTSSSVGVLLPEKGFARREGIVGSYKYDRRGVIGPISDAIRGCELKVSVLFEPVSGEDFRLESARSESVLLQSPIFVSE